MDGPVYTRRHQGKHYHWGRSEERQGGGQSTGEVAGQSDPEPGSPTVSDLAITVLRMDLANTYSEPLDLIV